MLDHFIRNFQRNLKETKTRNVTELSYVQLEQTEFQGKVLVSPDDGVGFAVYEIHLSAGESVRFSAFHAGENHVYYCITGAYSFFFHDCVQFLLDEVSSKYMV